MFPAVNNLTSSNPLSIRNPGPDGGGRHHPAEPEVLPVHQHRVHAERHLQEEHHVPLEPPEGRGAQRRKHRPQRYEMHDLERHQLHSGFTSEILFLSPSLLHSSEFQTGAGLHLWLWFTSSDLLQSVHQERRGAETLPVLQTDQQRCGAASGGNTHRNSTSPTLTSNL